MGYIKGNYTKCIFNNENNGYTVGIIKVKESDVVEVNENIYFVGTFFDLKLKSNYLMNGELVNHSKYGEQFSVNSYELVLPTENEELIEFLSSELFPIGEKMAKKIVDKFGNKTIETILSNKENLLLIPRLSEKKINKIYEALTNYQYSSQIVIDLSKMGFSTKNALTILNNYNSTSIDKINKNIYDLVEELDFNFIDIDNIALNNGVNEDDERRIKALIIHIMKELTFNFGSTYLEINHIHEEIIKYIKTLDLETLEYNIMKLNKEGKIIIKEDKYFLREYYQAEEYIADKLAYFNDLPKSKLPHLEDKLKQLEKESGIIYDETQKKAIMKAINNNLTIITGGPGTGKTTIIKAIVSLLKLAYGAKDDEIALLAPTGRASKKMMETTLIPSYTIHRYLAWDKESNRFNVNEYCPNKEKYIIVDEVSMIDTILMEALLKGINRHAKIILVGDYYQLPSVGQGQVLKDLIDSEVLDVVRLNCLYRQNDDSYIVNLANEIKDKELTESFLLKKDDYNFIDCDSENVLSTIENIVKKAISKGYSDSDIQILAPIYKSLNGIDNLNIVLQNIFNPKSHKLNEIKVGEAIYREGDKILQLVNDTENNVYNGDIGYIININNKTKTPEVTIDYYGTIVTYSKDKFANFRHGYAISVHKSQGGEFKMVIMPIVKSFMRMLYNKLVYTAVTRAKETLILIGDKQAFVYGVRNDYIDNRKTTLLDKLREKYE